MEKYSNIIQSMPSFTGNDDEEQPLIPGDPEDPPPGSSQFFAC